MTRSIVGASPVEKRLLSCTNMFARPIRCIAYRRFLPYGCNLAGNGAGPAFGEHTWRLSSEAVRRAYHEEQIARAIEAGRTQKSALVFLFEERTARCEAEIILALREGGALLDVFDESAKAQEIAETDRLRQTWRIDNGACAAVITMAKAVRKNDDWVRVPPIPS